MFIIIDDGNKPIISHHWSNDKISYNKHKLWSNKYIDKTSNETMNKNVYFWLKYIQPRWWWWWWWAQSILWNIENELLDTVGQQQPKNNLWYGIMLIKFLNFFLNINIPHLTGMYEKIAYFYFEFPHIHLESNDEKVFFK